MRCWATLLAVLFAAPAPGAQLSLRVDWNGTRARRPFPVTGGVPFARGVLKDARAVRLVSGSTTRGKALPLVLHETSWPATWSCELDLALYGKMLERIRRFGEYVLHGPLGTADIDTIIHRERIRPSVVLRTLYRGDGWRMQALLKEIGRNVPREQPLEKWEGEARAYLDHIRGKGVP